MASSGLGSWPLRSAARFARAAVPAPSLGDRSLRLDEAVADYLFGAATPEASAELQGSRLPDVDGGFRWSLQFRTDVQTAWDGSEKRIATIGRSRDRYEGSFFLADTDDRYVRSLLSRSPASLIELPMPHEGVAAISAITTGTIVVDTTYVDWAAIDRRVYIVGPAGDAYSAVITGVNGDTLNLNVSPPAGGSFPADSTMVYPVELVRLEDGQTIARRPVNAASWQFRARAAEFRALVGTGAELTQFSDSGLYVLNRRPHQSSAAQEQILGGIEFLDQGGYLTSTTVWNRSAHRRTLDFIIRTPAERQWWKLFLALARGRLKPFLCPTWRPDLTAYTAPSGGDEFLNVSEDYLNEWWSSTAHRRLQVEFTNGTVQWFSVTSATDHTDYQRLALDDAFPADVTIRYVSFLETVRLDLDEVTIEYGEGWRGRIQLPIVTVQESAPDVVVPGPEWPSSSEEMTAAAGFGVWSNIWKCDEASGSLVDAIAGISLVPGATPTYQNTGAITNVTTPDYAVGCNSVTDRFEPSSAATFDIGSTSIAFYMCIKSAIGAAAAIKGILSKIDATGQSYYQIRCENTSGHLAAYVRASSGSVVGTTLAHDHCDDEWHDVLLCIDRQSQRIQVISDLGSSTAADISAIGAINTAGSGVKFAVGYAATLVNDSHLFQLAFLAVATGDVDVLRTNAATMIANMRAFTDRT